MSEKLNKIGAERDRAKEKRDLWDARYKELCQKYTPQKNTEIHEMVRALNVTPDQLAAILKALQDELFSSPAAMPGAGVLMMGNLSAVCFAAEGAPAPTDGADKGGDTAEIDAPAMPDGVTLGTKVVLPEGVTISEDGKTTFSAQGVKQLMEALMGADVSGDTDAATDATADADTEAAPETVTIGTVNVRSGTYLNLRSGSGLGHSVIGHLLRGTEVEVIGESGGWYEVKVPEGVQVPLFQAESGPLLREDLLLLFSCAVGRPHLYFSKRSFLSTSSTLAFH